MEKLLRNHGCVIERPAGNGGPGCEIGQQQARRSRHAKTGGSVLAV